MGPLLKPADVAKLLGVSEMTVRRYVSDGVLKPTYVGRDANGHAARRRLRFKQSVVDAFIRKRSP
jgi:excisionase family DNA binding protein